MTSGASSHESVEAAQERGEPFRSINKWTESLREGDDAACQRAVEALVEVGLELASELPNLALGLRRLSGSAKAKATTQLGVLGIRLLSVIPRFREALRAVIISDRDENVRTSAIHALALLGPSNIPLVPTLVEALKDRLPTVRAGAAQDLAQLRAEARDSLPALTSACLHDSDLAVRVNAAVALWRVGRRSRPTIPALIEGLQSDDPYLLWVAAECLGELAAEATEAVPALIEALAKKPLPLIATTIHIALESIDPKAAASVKVS